MVQIYLSEQSEAPVYSLDIGFIPEEHYITIPIEVWNSKPVYGSTYTVGTDGEEGLRFSLSPLFNNACSTFFLEHAGAVKWIKVDYSEIDLSSGAVVELPELLEKDHIYASIRISTAGFATYTSNQFGICGFFLTNEKSESFVRCSSYGDRRYTLPSSSLVDTKGEKNRVFGYSQGGYGGYFFNAYDDTNMIRPMFMMDVISATEKSNRISAGWRFLATEEEVR